MLLTTHVIPTHSAFLIPHLVLVCYACFKLKALFLSKRPYIQSRERSLEILRQTGTVSQLAIAFQNITYTFTPRWSDHPLIFIFSRKLTEAIRFELTTRGSIPTLFSAYLASAISVEQNQAAAALSRSHPSSQPSRPPFIPCPPALASPPPHQPPPTHSQPTPMEVDGTRCPRAPLTMEERRRRADASLCAYCAQPRHTLATSPSAACEVFSNIGVY